MAEFIFKDLVKKANLTNSFMISSAATSTEEIYGLKGNPIYPPAQEQLKKHHIEYEDHRATQVKKSDYEKYDYLIYMDQNNKRNLLRIINNDPKQKCFRLLDFTEHPQDVEDPWYTGNFDGVFNSITIGCKALLDHIIKSKSF